MGVLWNNLKGKFTRLGSLDVTLRTLALGDRDDETGHREKDFSTTSTIQMIIVTRDARQLLFNVGTYVRKDAVGITDSSSVVEGDEILVGSTYYEADAVRAHKVTPDTVEFYECDLTEMTLHS